MTDKRDDDSERDDRVRGRRQSKEMTEYGDDDRALVQRQNKGKMTHQRGDRVRGR